LTNDAQAAVIVILLPTACAWSKADVTMALQRLLHILNHVTKRRLTDTTFLQPGCDVNMLQDLLHLMTAAEAPT
jgi:hypothetical protein